MFNQSNIQMKNVLVLVTVLWIFSCSTDTIKGGINKAGNVAGQTAGEFIEGAAKGVEKAFDVKVTLPENLKKHGVEFGKTYVTSDSIGTDNLLMVYVIFNKPYTDTLVAKVFDDNQLEMGRVSAVVSGFQNEAKFVAFHFDKRTNIDSKNTLTVE
ncbi:hypothetical protein CHU_1857 [Cytophaga hutchinsonii ATCC 33406]|uniref:Uncharacterized protein n=2 Tax=Cytophaga hutchinsonii TaxID=985 RepID=A0A6N4SS64_CYTH3|nr:hypothetical protein CHU_1857 [Cytophaga hutchinsonii ATCC 33406]